MTRRLLAGHMRAFSPARTHKHTSTVSQASVEKSGVNAKTRTCSIIDGCSIVNAKTRTPVVCHRTCPLRGRRVLHKLMRCCCRSKLSLASWYSSSSTIFCSPRILLRRATCPDRGHWDSVSGPTVTDQEQGCSPGVWHVRFKPCRRSPPVLAKMSLQSSCNVSSI